MTQSCMHYMASAVLLASLQTPTCNTSTPAVPTTVETTTTSTTASLTTTVSPTAASNSSSSFPGLDLPVNLTVVIIELASVTFSFALRKVLPVVDIAVEKVNRQYQGRMFLSVVYANGSCDKDVVGVAAARISCAYNITVFIGPACSKSTEVIAYMANEWNVPVITPLASTDSIGDKTVFSRLTRISTSLQSSYVDTVSHLMTIYGWHHAGFFYDLDENFASLLAITFSQTFSDVRFKWNVFEVNGDSEDKSHFGIRLRDAAMLSRVFIFCMEKDTLRDMLAAAYRLGYATSGDFVFLIITGLANIPTDESTWKFGKKSDEIVRVALSQALFLFINESRITLPQNFSQAIVDRALRDYNYNFSGKEPASSLAGYYDAVNMYATVVNETLAEGGNPYDGLSLTQRIWNRTFPGIAGRITVNKNGDRNSDVTIAAVNMNTKTIQNYAMFHSDVNMLTFYGDNSFPWPLNGGVPPNDEPKCGYTGDRCSATESSQLVGGLSGFFALATVVGLVAALTMFRRWKKYSDKDIWWWKIDAAQLIITDRKLCHSIPSFISKVGVSGWKIDTGPSKVEDGLMALFKGHRVKLRYLPIKQIKFTTDMLLDFKMVRDLSHNNLVRIFGACFDSPMKVLVMEHCNKGSLQDLIGNLNVTLDVQFKFSLCTDIINGLCYLHESPSKCHGRLNSEVCLVDNRFSVKLADYAIPSLYTSIIEDPCSQEYKTTCLWKAPEVLRTGDRRGSRESDIYSFAIILYELVTREFPYSNEVLYLTTEEILEKVRYVSSPPFRPSVDIPVRLLEMKVLMENCWVENPKDRPSAKTVKSAIKNIAVSLGETGNLLDNLMRRMELYANNLEKLVEDKTVELREEKKKSEELLYQILPRPVADKLKAGLKVEPESYDSVTIYFSDIVGFTTISAQSSSMQVVDLLNDLYSCFDATIEEYDVYKVETIGDAYMVVSGLPQRNGSLHAVHIARMSLQLLQAISKFKIRHMPEERMRLRIGLHSGPVCAGVVGLKMPRYCLFGDTVNTASRMESHGEAMMIHMSSSIRNILHHFGTFDITSRGKIYIKGKGEMNTYWLKGENTTDTKA